MRPIKDFPCVGGLLRTIALSILLCLNALQIKAEQFELVEWNGVTALLMTGTIEAGTTARFNVIADQAEIAGHGLPILLLDSPGGDVLEALMMSAAMRNRPFHTVIADGALCASACASIVFVAGRFRTMEAFGLYGQHSCSLNGVPDEGCNELISQHALQHGVSHGSIAAFITYVPPSDILWFSREDIDGWGISFYPGSDVVGFAKSEPRAIFGITGVLPPAQNLWRLDFWGTGWRAFQRFNTDADRELQVSQFCSEDIPGVLFLMMEIHGPSDLIENAVISARIATDTFSIDNTEPMIWQLDEVVTAVVVPIPTDFVMEWLTRSRSYEFSLELNEQFDPIYVRGGLEMSRENLIFAANHCDNSPP